MRVYHLRGELPPDQRILQCARAESLSFLAWCRWWWADHLDMDRQSICLRHIHNWRIYRHHGWCHMLGWISLYKSYRGIIQRCPVVVNLLHRRDVFSVPPAHEALKLLWCRMCPTCRRWCDRYLCRSTIPAGLPGVRPGSLAASWLTAFASACVPPSRNGCIEVSSVRGAGISLRLFPPGLGLPCGVSSDLLPIHARSRASGDDCPICPSGICKGYPHLWQRLCEAPELWRGIHDQINGLVIPPDLPDRPAADTLVLRGGCCP